MSNLPASSDVTDVDDRYVDTYVQSHADVTVEYKVGYRDYFTIDALLPPSYSALVAGCGTLGAPLKFLRDAGRIVGVDRSAKMLAAAERMSQRIQGKEVELVQSDIASFPAQCCEQFDFVELGLMGTYLPFDVDLIESYALLLRPGGLLLVASVVVPPAGLRPKDTLTRIRGIAAGALSTIPFWLTGKTTYRTSVSLRAVVRAVERWVSARGSPGIKLLYHEVRKNALETPVAYRALLKKER